MLWLCGSERTPALSKEASIKRAYKRTDTLLNTADAQVVNCGTNDELSYPASPYSVVITTAKQPQQKGNSYKICGVQPRPFTCDNSRCGCSYRGRSAVTIVSG